MSEIPLTNIDAALNPIESARGLFTPTLVHYVRALGGDKHSLALAAAVPSMTRTVCALVAGALCDVVSLRSLLLLCLALGGAANVLYLFALSPTVLILARSLFGASFAEIVVARTYVALVTTPSERTAAFAAP